MLASRTKTVSVSLPIAILILIQALGLFPSKVAAQCPTMSGEGATFGITKFNPVKSQMWYNDGLWWAVFSDNDTGLYFYSFPNGAATRGPIIDGNINGIPDALWDGTNLFVAVWKSVSLATLYKYTYNSGTKSYTLVSGFPVSLPNLGQPAFNGATAALVLEKDSTGKLWATYTGTQGGSSDGKIHVIWSTSADHKVWNTTGFDLATGLVPNTLEISAITRFGNKIGVAWSNQPVREIAFRYHVDGDPETTWSAKEVIDSGLGPRGLGGVADDHLALKAADDGRLFLVAKDNDNDGDINPSHATEGRLWLYIRGAAGGWGGKYNIQPDFSQLPTRPVLLLDNGNDRAYVLYSDASPSGAQRTFIAHTSMSSPAFTSPCVFTSVATSNPTSTKQNVSTATGIMAAASTGATGSQDIIFRSVVLSPVTAVASLSPSSAAVGGGAFTLTVTGSNFVNGSFVRFNGPGNERLTTFDSPNQLRADIIASDISAAGTIPVTVWNPATGEVTNAVNFTVTSPDRPVPILNSISSTTKTAGDAAFVLTLTGSNFINESVVRFNGSNRATTFVNANQLTAQITLADLATGGIFPITVFNPLPGGGTSSAINLTVNNPLPVLNGISPTSKFAGEAAFVLTANGSNFVNGSVVSFNGSSRTTTFVNSTQLTAQITAADILAVGTATITVFNAAPGGGTSTGASLTITPANPVPSIDGLLPPSANAGGVAFTLTVHGSSFINGSIVRWNGSNRTTTFVNSTQLTAQISAADIQTAGTAGITVFNSTPGGGLSNSVNFTINQAPLGYEADVAPRPNGSNNGTISISDWVQAGRFASGLDTPSAGSEFQRADCAPKSSLGGGTITISDWVQAGRYASGLDAVLPAGGPTTPPSVTDREAELTKRSEALSSATESLSIVRIVDATLQAGQNGSAGPNGTVRIELDSQGNENAVGFSINFDPTKLTYVSAAIGADAASGTMVVNPGSAAIGRVGFLVSLSSGSSFSVGTRQLVVLTFAATAGGSGSTAIGFGDAPIGREISDPFAGVLDATYIPGTVVIAPPPSQAPILASISPDLGIAGGPDFILTVNGSNFVSQSVVRWNGVNHPTTFVSNTQLTAQITTADLQAAGTTPVDVVNPEPGGSSSPVNFAVNNPAPTIGGLSPTSASAQGPFFTTITGSNFVIGSVVKWNNADRPTIFDSSTQLRAEITVADLQVVGNAVLTVFNPAPGGGGSNFVSFTVNHPNPSTGELSPAGKTAGGAAFTLFVKGTYFVNGSVVKWNGADRPTTYQNSTLLTAQISAADIQTAGTAMVTVVNPVPGGGISSGIAFTISIPPPQLQFSAASFNGAEGSNHAQITVNRSGDTSAANSVDYLINGSSVSAPCNQVSPAAAQNCDYTITAGTLQFAAGETSKTFIVPIIDDAYEEGSETLTLQLTNPSSGASLGTFSQATLTIVDNDSGVPTFNPIDEAQMFVRQHYLDFLNREPDAHGLGYWSGAITQCGTNEACIRSARTGVSAAFFVEEEFQRTGSFVYRLYQGGLALHPSYEEFNNDRAQVAEGPNLEATKQALALAFVQRPGFVGEYSDMTTADLYVEALIDSIRLSSGVELSGQRTALINKYNSSSDINQSRALALRDAIDNPAFIQAEYNEAFVLMQYFGYLRRDPDPGGYNFWLGIVNNVSLSNYRSMVCAFLTSAEYQERFSSVRTATDKQCGP